MTNIKATIGAGVLGLGILVGGGIGLASLTSIKQGHVGVEYSRSNGGVQEQTLGEGWHFISPMSKVTEYPVALETVNYKELSLATKDGKPLTIDITFNYMNDVERVAEIYTKFKGANPEAIEKSFLLSRAKENALAVTSQYTILDIFQKREEIQTKISESFTSDLAQYGFVVSDFVLGTPVPDQSTQQAIQKVVDAQQELEQLKIETQKAEETAKKQLIEAEGRANAEVAQAEGTAKANAIVSASITENILKQQELSARQKHGWVTVQGGTPIVDVK